ncbi:HD-GYP domain-containing protein [Curvibacter sp. HBC61]|uniref:HD-GYP domain-containing protein n=1 Tax=Curvibacter cyanobacteriorum TaxID=3026422 RepID=A0ABT5N490_9BURK|nr:HD-GYP domain-containing protein [Curvibacter sp. HBC61]MDD0840950.1 HD-GYP domain-containing protein [Curvibacter sp. HBC61]
MLKIINAQQLQLGMYLHKFGGSWLKHPFWRTAFLLEDVKDLNAIVASGIDEIWIDVSKGCDVAAPGPAQAPAAAAPVPEAPAVLVAKRVPPAPTSMGQELVQAKKILLQSRDAVTSLFNDVRLGKAIDVNGAAPLVEEVTSSVIRNPGALVSIVRLKSRDDYTYLHSVAVCALMVALARQLGLDEAQTRDAAMGGLMHDLGKALMPLEVLNKPGSLTEAEYAIMKSHPEEGWRLLREGGGASEATLDIALHHHEKIDGSGYPHKLKGDGIQLLSRMGAICDVYDAITSNRPYKAGWDPGTSIRRMNSWAGHFDPHIMKAFIRSIGIYPVGALVRLESGRLGVVTEQHAASLLTPKVTVFFSTKSNEPIVRQVLDLAAPNTTDKIVAVEDKEKWGFKYLDEIWSET